MPKEVKANINYKQLNNLLKALSTNINVKVGLLAGKGGDEEVSENLDLAGLGAVHEFGARIQVTPKMRAYFRHKFEINLKKDTTEIVIPARSFLRMPIEHSKELMNKIKQQTDTDQEFIMAYLATTGDYEFFGKVIGIAALEQIQEAFATGGFGEWPPDSPMTIKNKGSNKPLIGEGRLSNLITFEVEER